jgi:P-type Cu+ transporter
MTLAIKPDSTTTCTLVVEGMTCAGCVRRVERSLLQVRGVAAASVNLVTGHATITAAAVPDSELTAAVAAAGYAAKVLEAAPPEPPSRKMREDDWRVLLSALLTVPLVAPMLLAPFGVHWMPAPLWQLLLATPVQVWLGARFYRAGWAALRHGSGNMELLVAIGTTAAYGLSVAMMLRHAGHAMPHLYFEASTTVITLVLLGKRLEARAIASTADALRALESLQPTEARLIEEGHERMIAVARLRRGDLVAVLPGERFPVDGEVVVGRSHADESLVTGESMPVAKSPGSRVIGGAVNGEGALRITATGIGTESTLAAIVRLVETAQVGKAPIQRLADRVSAVFVPLVLVIALATFIGWWLQGAGFEHALINAVSVLVIACPCALGLATPTAIMVGTGVGARHGILVRDAATLEAARQVGVVAFDKTGTLTEGRPRLLGLHPAAGVSEADLLGFSAGLQSGSSHPLATAVLEAARERGVAPAPMENVVALPGRGVQGLLRHERFSLGNARLAAELEAEQSAPSGEGPGELPGGLPADLQNEAAAHLDAGRTLAWLVRSAGTEVAILGLLAFGDTLKPAAAAAIRSLRVAGIRTLLLTGDTPQSAALVARELRLDGYHASLLPADKLARLGALQGEGRVVAMVGDGINDAPALAAADVGIAMGGGTAAAQQAAGIILMRGDPRLVAGALDLSRHTWRKIRQGLFWAFAYNVLGLPLAAAGLLNPMIAGGAMALSSVSVVANALRLRRWRPATA